MSRYLSSIKTVRYEESGYALDDLAQVVLDLQWEKAYHRDVYLSLYVLQKRMRGDLFRAQPSQLTELIIYDWPIVFDAQGEEACAVPYECMAIVGDGAGISLSVISNTLDSITCRSFVVSVQDVLKRPFLERTIDRAELYSAEELFLRDTGWEIMPVVSRDCLPIGDRNVGPIASEMHAVCTDSVRARHEPLGLANIGSGEIESR